MNFGLPHAISISRGLGAWVGRFQTIAILVALATSTPLFALTFSVDNTGDFPDNNPGDGICANTGGFCTLRAAVMEGNALSGPHVINLPAGTYSLSIPSGNSDLDASVGDLDLTSDTWTFNGAGMGQTIIDASAMNHRAFEIPVDLFFSGSVAFNDLTIQGGNTSGLGGSFNSGAAVRVSSRFASMVSFSRVAITGNTGNSAISTLADTTVDASVISNNSGTGLFQTNDGAQPTSNVRTLDITDSTISGNGGTGIAIGNNDAGSLINSTVSGNGIHGLSAQFTNNKDFTITNSTVATNGQDGVAGIGFTIFDPVFGNIPVRPDLLVRNSIVADNARSDFTTPALDSQAEVPQSGGFNVIGDNSGGANFTQTGDVSATDPMLAALALNPPGNTQTHALLGGSPAIDRASAASAPATDQRGVTRPQGAAADSGSFEFKPTISDLSVAKTADVASAGIGDPVIFTITVSNTGPDTVAGAAISDIPGADFSNVTWTCTASVGSNCSNGGTGPIDDAANIPVGGQVTYTLNTTIASSVSTSTVTNSASAAVPAGASDPSPANNQDSASITITNQPPMANGDTFEIDEDTAKSLNVAGNDTDADGNLDPSSANTVCGTCSTPANGALANNGDGTFGYNPNADFFGSDSFVYQICDTVGTCDTATVNIDVAAVNDQPSFNAGANPVFPAGTSGSQSISNWPQNVDLGPNETQQVDSYTVTTLSDPDGVLSGAAAISVAGELTFSLTGASGTAQLEATLTDDGGTPNGGDDTSAPVAFSITVADPAADLEAGSVQCSSRAAPGEPYAYSIVIVNNGPDDASGVAASHEPIPGAVVNSITSPDCVDTGTAVDCDLGAIAAGGAIQVGIEIQAPNVGAQSLTMTTSVVAATVDPSPGNNENQVSVEIVPGLIVVDGFEACTP